VFAQHFDAPRHEETPGLSTVALAEVGGLGAQLTVKGLDDPFEVHQTCQPHGNVDTMKTTIDKAGRVVIPATVRERAGFDPGTTLDISMDEFGVRLQRVAPGPRLVRVGGRLVARPVVEPALRPRVDVAALVEEERNRWP
jgi:AbrB family looped-hinge helix DNA binding protein